MLNAQSPFAETETTRPISCLPVFNFCDQSHPSGAPAATFNRPSELAGMRDHMKPVEDILSSEMNKLSVQERSKALDDIHCVGDELHETPEIVEKSLREFQHLIKKKKNPIYEMAVNQNRAFVEDPDFRLKFLRASLHDVRKAVLNMLEFLRFKATYFGIEKLTREITFDDLDEGDKEVLFSGLHHIQDGTDRMGRPILYFFNVHMGKGEIGSHVRATYYIMYNILGSMSAVPLKGVAGCFYDLSRPGENVPKPGFNFMVNINQFLNCIPVRVAVHHICLRTADSANLALNKFIVEMGLKLFPRELRVRTRIHFGTDMELQYELQGHGIPMDMCPVNNSGNIRKDIQTAWIDKYHSAKGLDPRLLGFDKAKPNKSQATENPKRTTSSITAPPPPHDILLGRGRAIQSHPGNVCFREYLKQYIDEYDQAPRNLRRTVLWKIREDLNKRDIRFLQERNGAWVECSSGEADKTISQAFRNMRKKSKKEEKAS